MAKYNIYKIKEGQAEELMSHLVDDRGYAPVGSFDSGNYKLNIYFAGPDHTDIWWLEQYSEYFGEYAEKHNEVYSGAIVAVNVSDGNLAYAIPLGKTHFYVQKFIEASFGLELAELIADDKQAKMKGLKSHGGKTSKALVSYTSDSALLFSGGESAEYLKLRAQDKEKWGRSFIHFGSSVQFNGLDIEPADLGGIFSEIDGAFRAGRKNFNLPFSKEIKDEALKKQLNVELADNLLESSGAAGLLDYEIYGIDFVFSQQTHVRLRYEDVISDLIENFTIENIITFAEEKGIDLRESLPDIKVQVLVSERSIYTVPLLHLIEYYGEGKTFLCKGKWFVFTESYIERLHKTLDNVETSRFGTDFSEEEYRAWEAERKANNDKLNYRERFILSKIHDLEGYEIIDRELDYVSFKNKRYSLEVGDLYDRESKEIFVVKIGEPRDFGYAFDQAYAALQNMNNGKYVTSRGAEIPIEFMNILLLFRTDRELASPKDTKSLIFEIKLNELYKLSVEKGVKLKLSYSTVL